MLRVYYTELSDALSAVCLFPLSTYRKQKLETVKASQLRRQMLAAEQLLCRAVADWNPNIAFPLQIECSERGKPYFCDLPLFFSLSHSGDYAACALADYEIGLDIQVIREANETLCNRFFTEQERLFLKNGIESDRVFTRIWSMKESYLKAVGDGLARPLTSFSVSLNTESLENDSRVRFWHYGEERFELALCALDGKDPLPEFIRAEAVL